MKQKGKNMKLLRLILVVALTGLSANSNATQTLRDASCKQWINSQSTQVHYEYMSWLMGYLSGIAIQSDSNIFKTTNPDSIFLWMDTFCRNNPQNYIGDGAWQLSGELQQKLIK